MKVSETSLPGVLLIEPRVFADPRGMFWETYQAKRYADAGMAAAFVQDNGSRSARGTLRGLHYQLRHTQAKLVWVTRGEVFDVVVDIRRGSPHFGRWFGTTLAGDQPRQLYTPPGFAHGFCVLSEFADFAYKCSDYYTPDDEYGIIWNDPDLGIPWPVAEPLLSAKDRGYPTLKAASRDELFR